MVETSFDGGSTPIGRDRETAELQRWLNGAQSGSGAGSVLVLRGDAGIGKSTLLEAGQRLALEQDMRVLGCRGVRAESNIPFAALHQLVHPILSLRSSISRTQADLIDAALGLDESMVADLYRVALAALELVAAAAAEAPVLLVIDDAHWADRPSAEVLAFIGRRIAAEPVAMLVAMRGDVEDPFAAAGFSELVITSLDPDAAEALLSRAAPGLRGEPRARMLESAAGNPLALVHLPAIPEASGPLPDAVAVGDLLERSFVARITELPPPTRHLLLAAALDPSNSVEQLRAAAAEVMGDSVELNHLQPAIDTRLVRLDGTRIAFCHPLLAAAIAQHAKLDERVRTHLALARTLAHDDERRVWHLAAAALGPDDGVATALAELAERAARRGAIAVSVAALDRAATLASSDSRRADMLLRASVYALESGRGHLAIELAGRTDKERLAPPDRARMLIVVREASPGLDVGDRTVPELVEAAATLRQSGENDLAAAVLWTAASHCWWTSADEAVRRTVVAATTQLRLETDDPRRAAILSYTASPEQRAALWHDLVSITPAGDDLAGLRFVASAAYNLGAHALAARTLASAVTVARQQGRLGLITRLQALQAWASLWSASLAQVEVTAGEAERLAEELDQPLWRQGAHLELAIVSGLQGNYTAAKEQIRTTLTSEVLHGVRLHHAMALYGLGVAALGVGQYQDAYELLRRIIDPADESSHYGARQWVVADLAEAALGAGELTDCQDVLTGLVEEFAGWPVPAVRHSVVLAQALLAPDSSTGAAFSRALAADNEGDALAQARVRLAYGTWLRRQRKTREARELLHDARQGFARLGMSGFAQRAAGELRAAGGAEADVLVDLPRLTSQELQIAQLAAEGLSNRQIGERLFLSHRTVGSHLYHLFPKLGIRTRSELAGALAPRHDR